MNTTTNTKKGNLQTIKNIITNNSDTSVFVRREDNSYIVSFLEMNTDYIFNISETSENSIKKALEN